MADISKVQEILKDANFGEYVSLKCENNIININGHVVYLSEDTVDAVDINKWEKGWPKEEPTDLGPLCFTAEEADSTVKIPFANFKISHDGTTWTPYVSDSTITLANVGDKVYFKANGSNDSIGGSMFAMTGKIAASGNINSLLTDNDKYAMTIALSQGCYQHMFDYCYSLTKAPELPSTILADECYQGMFYGCSSLTQAPKLPAATLAYGCYADMFRGCESLTQAPELPAKTLATYCYGEMFYDCTALTQAPELPAATLAEYCYQGMFYGCSSLTQAPKLPAATLAYGCYSEMFYDCTALTQAPELPAKTLASECYYNMFYNIPGIHELIINQNTNIVKTNVISWGLGIPYKQLVVITCSNGFVILNDSSQSSDDNNTVN